MSEDLGYTPGAGGRESLTPCESALSSLPLCEDVTDGRTCLAPLSLVRGTLYRVRCAPGHERRAEIWEVLAIEGAVAAYERRGGVG